MANQASQQPPRGDDGAIARYATQINRIVGRLTRLIFKQLCKIDRVRFQERY
ncbi:MAG: hypothetical protein SWJ54_10465 [Cyanobacteriota bacterium]|nr:hypothetical protein [Cyanobacteriota bacterium]